MPLAKSCVQVSLRIDLRSVSGSAWCDAPPARCRIAIAMPQGVSRSTLGPMRCSHRVWSQRCHHCNFICCTQNADAVAEGGDPPNTLTCHIRLVGNVRAQRVPQMESEENTAGGEVDLVLEDELENEVCDELADVDLAHELVLAELPYDVHEDNAKVCNTALAPVPASVAAELAQYEAHRMEPFNRHREGGGVVSTTVESDKSNALRFLGYMKAHHAQIAPSVKLFAHPRVGEWCEQWVRWLKGEQHQLKASTCAVYINGLIAVAGFAITLVEDPDTCPMAELLRLRSQAESIAKQERLFAVKSPNWIR